MGEKEDVPTRIYTREEYEQMVEVYNNVMKKVMENSKKEKCSHCDGKGEVPKEKA